MGIWDDLETSLTRIRDHSPHSLIRWPSPRPGETCVPPFEVGLATWATDAARELHEQFGDDVRLTVGALHYPERIFSDWAGEPSRVRMRPLDGSDVEVRLDGSLAVSSGYSADHGLLLSNKRSRELLVRTGSWLIAEVVDPGTGELVGGHIGPAFPATSVVQVASGATVRVPLRVSTDSFLPDLGYAVPPGEWGVQVDLEGEAGQLGRTPILPVTITAWRPPSH